MADPADLQAWVLSVATACLFDLRFSITDIGGMLLAGWITKSPGIVGLLWRSWLIMGPLLLLPAFHWLKQVTQLDPTSVGQKVPHFSEKSREKSNNDYFQLHGRDLELGTMTQCTLDTHHFPFTLSWPQFPLLLIVEKVSIPLSNPLLNPFAPLLIPLLLELNPHIS